MSNDTTTCDHCGKDMDGPINTVRVYLGNYTGLDHKSIIFRPKVDDPAVTGYGYACEECVVEAMREFLRRYDVNGVTKHESDNRNI